MMLSKVYFNLLPVLCRWSPNRLQSLNVTIVFFSTLRASLEQLKTRKFIQSTEALNTYCYFSYYKE